MSESQRVSRRQALRAGAVGAGVAWVVPAVTVIGVGPASADSASGGTPPPTSHTTSSTTKSSTTTSTTTSSTTTSSTTSSSVLPTSAEQPPSVEGQQYANGPGEQVLGTMSALPFTGAEVASVAAVGAGLLAAGIATYRAASVGQHGDHRADD